MKIMKFEKQNNNKYKVYFENNENVVLYDDVIVKYNLLSNNILDEELLKEIMEYNDFLEGYYISIKYISKKLRTEKEMRIYLKDKIISKNIDEVIKKLKKDGYINAAMYLKSYIHDKFYLSNDGPEKILNDLLKHDYDKDAIKCNLVIYDWMGKLKKAAGKKIEKNKKDSDYMLKNKLKKDLYTIGYDNEIIDKYLNSLSFTNREESILKMNIAKAKNRYKLKYDDEEAKTRVINSLYKKGFKLDEIKRYYDEN